MLKLKKGLSTFSCIIRNDFNVVFSFVLLIIYNAYYADNKALFGKVIFQTLGLLVALDLLWLIVVIPFWSSSEKDTEFFKSLGWMHTVGIILAFVQLGIKAALGYLVFNGYKREFPDEHGDLLKVDYIVKQEG